MAWLALDMAKELIKATRGKIAVIVDDAFQILGVKESAIYVKALLNLIEYPPESYERIVTIAATSEGISKYEIGRHRWAYIDVMWNMPRGGFEQLYGQISGDKPLFEDVWRITGGNPKALGQLYEANWSIDSVVDRIINERVITPRFISRWRGWLEEAVRDPDALWSPDAPEELINELVEKNLIIYFLPERNPEFWIDEPPGRDPELGIGKYVAWQTPLHREAVRRALQDIK
ncbi:ATP-binding protein [Vulcanisaeta sp. JCM 16159]|uniref:ATP-binding protein n=1 Tax=Vulcanisaeta sp. JCM 16159 TaxID=1295371 RepID=UPI003465CDA6